MGLVREVGTWWVARMAELTPAALRRGRRAGPDAVVAHVLPGSDEISVALRRRGREVPLGRVEPGQPGGGAALAALLGPRPPARTLLAVPAALLLEREVALPLAAEPDLARVVGHELDRLTPFAAGEAWWAAAVVGRDRARGRLRVRLSVVPRAVLAAPLAALAAAGRPADGLLAAAPGGEARHIGLEAPAADAPGGRGWRAAGLAACAALALAALLLPPLRRARALDAVEARIAALRPAVAEAEALRRRVAGRTAGAAALGAEAARLGRPLEVLATLTALLPDDAHLTALALRQGRLTLSGEASDAARLLLRLSGAPGLREAAFLAPVTRSERARSELFSLRVELGS